MRMNTISKGTTTKLTSPVIVLPFFLLSAISFLILTILILISSNNFNLHYFQPKLLAITHITALGFITSAIFGSLLQILPIIFEANIFSERLVIACFYSLMPGIILLSYSFWKFETGPLCHVGACLTLISFILFGLNFYISVKRCKSWEIESDIISTSLIWLLTTAVIGVLLVFNFSYTFIPISHLEILKIHAHIGFVGWLFLLTQGIASRLFPLFLASPQPSKVPLKYSCYLSNVGLIIMGISIYAQFPIHMIFLSSLFIIAAIISFLYYIHKIFIKRTRRNFDTGLKLTFLSFIILTITIPFALIIPYDLIDPSSMMIIRIIYGILVLLGFSGTLILGQTLKIIPLLLSICRDQIIPGDIEMILSNELISEKLSNGVMYSFLTGLSGLAISIKLNEVTGIQASSILLIISAILFNFNLANAFYKQQKFQTKVN